MGKMIAHHKIELTPGNVNDPMIALNIDNLEALCQDCHNKEHHRFGTDKEVVIVWGSPLSGKTTFVNEQARYGDIVLDLDSVWQCVTGQERYSKPNQCKAVVFNVWREMLSCVKQRTGQWGTAWVIMSNVDRSEVDRKAKELGAEVVTIESTYEECVERCNGRPAEWVQYVCDWWAENE